MPNSRMGLHFEIKNKIPGALGRRGVIQTAHGAIETPAYAVVGTKGTVKGITPEQLRAAGAQVLLANTYHLYLQPGEKLIADAGGLSAYMRWGGPTITDSGGFQVFSLGAAFDRTISKIAKGGEEELGEEAPAHEEERAAHRLAKIDEEGVTFRSHIDGSEHRFTPESSIEVQHKIGADIIFAFDECTSPRASHAYQQEAMERTHRWAKRSLKKHKELCALPRDSAFAPRPSALFGIVQGGRFEDLRKESAATIGAMRVDGQGFDGFGIGGSFNKEDMGTAVRWVNELLPEEKPRHLLGIGEPRDILEGVENGCDLFDCVAATRMGRNGSLYTRDGRINMTNAAYIEDEKPIDPECGCYVCTQYDRRYLAHLFRAKEMLAPMLGSIHNVSFILELMGNIRESITEGTFPRFKNKFMSRYYG